MGLEFYVREVPFKFLEILKIRKQCGWFS